MGRPTARLSASEAPSTATTIAPVDTSIYTALGPAAALDAQAFDAALLDRLATAPASAGAGAHDGMWATLTDGYARADGSGTASAFGAHRYGFAADFDHHVGDRTLIGGAIGYEHDDIGESSTPDTGKLDTIRFAAYGSRMLGPIDASAVFGYGSGWASEKRPFGAGSNSTPEGSNWLQALSGKAQAGLPLPLGGNTVLEPRAGLHWAWLHGQGFTESGSGGQNLAVGADTVHSAQPYVGLTLMHAFGTADKPVNVHLDLDYARELAGRTRTVTVFAQDGTAFAAPGAPLARDIVSLGTGVRAQIGQSWSVSGEASTQFREGSMVHVQLNYRF
ncbi:autotransporter outer membrane beta-barrel domain-containing protein [Trinickia dinghuensis]|uniref:autotransporter outer membrane beta-barrel domain-containing protein n=1 Tax=Trinickia dinghuensis TaxID=2291023 RepID=UPI0015F190AF|nr:autotransporter outer membrane beta-barrel domain-containing protein [Trinickia dinghuensis]